MDLWYNPSKVQPEYKVLTHSGWYTHFQPVFEKLSSEKKASGTVLVQRVIALHYATSKDLWSYITIYGCLKMGIDSPNFLDGIYTSC